MLSVLLAVMLCGPAGAGDAVSQAKDEKKPFHATFFGEGGSYHEPDQGAKEYLEKAPPRAPVGTLPPAAPPKKTRDAFIPRDPASLRYHHPAPETPRAEPTPTPPAETPYPMPPQYQAPAEAQSAPVRDAVGPPPPGGANLPRERRERREDTRRYSLWEGMKAPLALPSDKVSDVSPDQASALGRQDYESHVLGAAAPAGLPHARAFADAKPQAAAQSPRAETFVALDLDLKGAPLKDAVADLATRSGFREDERFAPELKGVKQDRASVWGWLPSDKIGEIMQNPAVARLQTDGSAAPDVHRGLTSQILVGVRVRGGQPPAETFRRVVGELSAGAQFRLDRAVGYQEIPGTKDVAVIGLGEVPISALERVMSHPDVVKVLPAPKEERGIPLPSAGAGSRPEGSGQRGFVSFVGSRAPLLLIVTLALILAPLGGRVLSWLEFLSPYSRRTVR